MRGTFAAIVVCSAISISIAEARPRYDRGARACEYEDDDDRPEVLVSVGFAKLGIDVDQFNASVSAFSLAAGLVSGNYYTYAELLVGHQHGKLGNLRTAGLAAGASLHVRRTLGVFRMQQRRPPIWMMVGSWIDVGIGYHLLRWDDGQVARPEASLGFGGGNLFGRRAKSVGLEVELRMVVSPGARWDAALGRCIGACEMAPPSLHRYDLGTLLMIRFPFSW